MCVCLTTVSIPLIRSPGRRVGQTKWVKLPIFKTLQCVHVRALCTRGLQFEELQPKACLQTSSPLGGPEGLS